MERKTEISFTCSYKFPVIDDDSEKKQINIVMAITTLNIISSVCSAYREKMLVNKYLILLEIGLTYLLSVVQDVLEGEECILVFETFSLEQ